jgi:hypothetical protein
MNPLIDKLNSEPALAWKVTVNVLGKPENSPEAYRAHIEVRDSPLVHTLLSERGEDGTIITAPDGHMGLPEDATQDRKIHYHPYTKWRGAHWILSILADLGYPSGDASLLPMMEETYNAWLGPHHEQYIRQVPGRTRRCASQEGNAVWSSLRLGLADGRTDELVSRLLKWQWPDGGWNCDKNPLADTSSFMETLIPLRALALYAQVSGDPKVKIATERAAQIFLMRHLFKRLRDGALMDGHFVRLHYPVYWHYDILAGLKVMSETGYLSDPRCQEALDLLESKRLPGDGFPAEETYTHISKPSISGYSLVGWAGVGAKKMNPFVTADALYVLRMAGRFTADFVG